MGRQGIGLRALLALAWPVVLSRSAQAVIGFCDALMTAPLGEESLAAATTGAVNTFALMILPMGVVFIVQSFASQLSGKHDLAGARRYGWYGLMLAVIAGLMVLPLRPLVSVMLSASAYEPQVQGLMAGYIEIRLLAVMAVVGFEAIGNWYGGLGNTRLHMIGSVLIMVLNFFFNYMLIEGHWGMPALGVQGAAWASVISTWCGFGLLLLAFVLRWGCAKTEGPLHLTSREFLRMLRFGLPSGLNWFMEFAAFMIFIDLIIADIGTVTVAAFMVVFQVNSVSYMPSFGLASSGAILAGQSIGAGQHDEVPRIARLTMATAAVWQVGVGLLYLIAPAAIMMAFAPRGQEDPAIVEVGATLLALSAAWQLFDAIGITLSEVLRAAGDTSWTMWARMISAWLLFLPLAWVSVVMFDGGGVAALLSMVVYLGLLALAFGWRFRSGVWRSIELTE
ncbi:MAG: MATE family efflux transporter [Myxococcales bacterium]|nr:MATE family efflux transporter [Myxococcales bacterium]